MYQRGARGTAPSAFEGGIAKFPGPLMEWHPQETTPQASSGEAGSGTDTLSLYGVVARGTISQAPGSVGGLVNEASSLCRRA